MSSKKLIAFIVLILIIILAVFSFFYSNSKKKDSNTTPDSETSFPSGGDSGNTGFPDIIQTEGANKILNPGEVLDSTGEVVKKEEARLRQITTEPVAGGYITQQTMTTEEEVLTEEGEEPETVEVEVEQYLTYYIQKKNGHILIDSDREDEQIKMLNQTIPQTELGLLTEDFALLQYLDSTKEIIRSFGGIFTDETISETETNEEEEEITTESIQTVFKNTPLPSDILFPSISPNNDKLSFIIKDNTGSSIVVSDVSNLESGSIVYETPLLDIMPSWGNDGFLYINSKADSRSTGFLKRVSPSTGEESTILSGIFGLTSLVDYSGNMMIVSSILNGAPRSLLYNKELSMFVPTGIYTLPEKCVWSLKTPEMVYCMGQETVPQGEFPQDWYQGKVSFSDILWKINTETLEIREEYTFLGIDHIFDGTNLQLSPDETRLFFVDKVDSTPWVLRLD